MFTILEELIAFLTLLVTLFIAMITFYIKWKKLNKKRNTGKMLILVERQLTLYIEQAEQLNGFNGRQKKQWVIECIREFGKKSGININGSISGESIDAKTISDMIESYITFSNKVNRNKH